MWVYAVCVNAHKLTLASKNRHIHCIRLDVGYRIYCRTGVIGWKNKSNYDEILFIEKVIHKRAEAHITQDDRSLYLLMYVYKYCILKYTEICSNHKY